MDSTVDPRPADRPVTRSSGLRALLGGATAAAGVLVLIAAAGVVGVPLQVQVGTRAPQDVTIGAAVSIILVSGAAAWGTAALANRMAPRPRLAFLVAAVLALALSVLPPATAATGGAVWWLEAMHLLVFAAIVAALAPALPSRRTPRPAPQETTVHGGASAGEPGRG